MLKIEDYPNAFYDRESKFGYLVHYYPYPRNVPGEEAITPEEWRRNSYSPEILNYKEGREEHLRWFVRPFLQLVEYAMSFEKFTEIVLIPVPSSIAFDNPKFSRSPRKKGGSDSRNRDNRNFIFTSFLSMESHRYTLRVADILKRVVDKKKGSLGCQATRDVYVNLRQSIKLICFGCFN
jgi:hypothetical protein